ncbi:hypothetical protein [Acuticoccus sp.]|uniref:hypothetical protein n=1 Tax=Acuticoccus sp. TaxID=1904378 RepID=UPI003B524852
MPAVHGLRTTVYTRWHRWSQRRSWQGRFAALLDETLCKPRNSIERTIGHRKDGRRVATRYDRPSATYAIAIALATPVTSWC